MAAQNVDWLLYLNHLQTYIGLKVKLYDLNILTELKI